MPKVPPESPALPKPVTTSATIVQALMGGGLLASAIGVTLGIAMALQRNERPCPDGTSFASNETDLRCFVHPRALEGSAIAMICVALAIVTWLVGILILSTRGSTPGAEATSTPPPT